MQTPPAVADGGGRTDQPRTTLYFAAAAAAAVVRVRVLVVGQRVRRTSPGACALRTRSFLRAVARTRARPLSARATYLGRRMLSTLPPPQSVRAWILLDGGIFATYSLCPRLDLSYPDQSVSQSVAVVVESNRATGGPGQSGGCERASKRILLFLSVRLTSVRPSVRNSGIVYVGTARQLDAGT